MPRNHDIKKVLVIGSGPIIIGQAAEFDYAGTQACRSLKEEGLEVVLLNSNPATIMTDKDIADRVYIEPLTVEVVEQLILKERPDSVLPTLGGQAGLNLAMEMEEAGFFKENDVRLIGTTAETIKKAEDRLEFKATMEKIGEPVAASLVVENVEDGVKFAEEIGYPVVLRPAYTLGGSGGGIANNIEELEEILANGLRLSRVGQVLVERCIAGWKEIEYEVMRDGNGNCITVCNMENIDPVGVHTGDSIVVAPSQTLGDKEYQMLRTSALNIISELNITGGCNVQYALHPDTFEYCVIEVNPRVSRSSALASKATGYPIAKVAAKIALGYTLDEIQNAVTKKTYASFEPMLDYCVVKLPRLPFDKFISAKRTLTTQMKATGEVMSICDNFEGALMKAIRSLEQHVDSLMSYDFTALSKEEILDKLEIVDDRRIWLIAEALRKGITYEQIHAITKIDKWFIDKIAIIVEMEEALKTQELTAELLKEAKRIEFPDNVIARLTGKSEAEIHDLRHEHGIVAAYKMVDTCAAEFAAETPYYYSVFGSENEVIETKGKKKVLVLGSGPIRIGQGIEFDFCSVHCTWAFSKEGYETIIVNNNPETVSTDFDIADKLYFEPLTPEDVKSIVDLEKPDGAVVQFGGQTAIKLTEALMKMGVPILGTSAENVDAAEDRELFDEILAKCGIPRPKGDTVYTAKEAKEVANRLGYPVLVRPSYVLGGQGMQIAISDHDIDEFIGIINRIAQDHPILVDKYLVGKEIEVDAVCDGEDILIPGIMEHIERAGIHSGDSISVYPAQSISEVTKRKIEEYTKRLARALHVIGMINIQFIVCGEDVYVIEVNPRSSRTVPYISKVTGIPIVPLATKVIIGHKIKELGYTPGLQKEADYIAIKMPVFSFEKIRGADISLGPEMKSTGECLGIASTFNEALYKAFLGAGINLPKYKNMIMTVRDEDKVEATEIGRRFEALGYRIFATRGTAEALKEGGVKAIPINKIEQESPNLMDLILGHEIDLVIDTPPQGADRAKDGFLIRRNAIETGVNVLTALDTAKALVTSLENTDIRQLTLIDIATIDNR
ncbi:carbamoyl-phosphate synthase large subunit [Bariatricus massiliensis]|uniref:Carbamoyl phosphate synthase large chain n=1 Tax=Bariatricus massiliensis TaxID=1745713 RepID=A0ABS8DCU5_9FIRM|nr:carbamoyl-phosphate synthase large subunit [Bariatricus massiliensis]MCB7303425.1 carbamoyl-phosphate synthase large subunit [Bariatricus massiliensis]MCB7373557.1 carbamoyl-phosphate synthase large subunit [Bariatricus massiliensis]MCB7386227.1 carbamoyl-phosphate synthase large subunit [Bariatricus massiliensis]MCB7410389.1 carbamoyl-phosphate synthase large subunit [Bariatricus massiliensis]MCQ5252327.1 carbamoyl-phosphate synthase large subunit [Bariatricus massiliensis]